LVEKPGRLPGQLVGRSPYLQAVHIMATPDLIGSVRRVTINEIGSNSLFGALADETRTPALAPAGA
jgi:tRNA-2-methylthio-N6-dimethylallyladenosine synthase